MRNTMIAMTLGLALVADACAAGKSSTDPEPDAKRNASRNREELSESSNRNR